MGRTCLRCSREFEGPARKGMCHGCYSATQPRKDPLPAICHPEKNAYRKGLCAACYVLTKKPADCHPDRPHHSLGFCTECYQQQWLTPEKLKRHNATPAARAARARYNKTEKGKRAKATSEQRRDPDGRMRQAISRRHYETHQARLLDPEYMRMCNLRKNYGITLAEWDTLFESQSGCCAICGTSEPGGFGNRLAVDHCHETKVVRGLLCMHCNQAIGKMHHDVRVLQAAITYLQAPPAPTILDQVRTDPCR